MLAEVYLTSWGTLLKANFVKGHHRMRSTLVLLLVALPGGSSHGSLIMPRSRNTIDADTEAWSNGKHPDTGSIEPYNCACTNGTSVCNNGQSCFWFSQGCTIGCKDCDGNGARYPNFDHCPGESIAPTLNGEPLLS